MAHEKLILKIKGLIPEGKKFLKVGSDLAVIMPDKTHIDLHIADYENQRGELENYIKSKV